MTNLKEPEELCLCKNSNKNGWLFDCRYIIPIYQREYAWHWEDEITRLINDINSICNSESTTYRLGCMSVRTTDTAKFEVIDGQQRLTTIYLLLTALAATNTKSKSEIVSPEINVLTFEGREASNYTLCHIKELHSKTADNSVLRLDNGIVCAYRSLYNWAEGLNKTETEREKFLNRLKRTTIYRIPIPQETDLCKYFIRMNARGKQLELSDILKARLMKHLCAEDLPGFNNIWTACSNMNSYLEKLLKDEEKELLNKPALDGVSFFHRDHTVEKPNLSTFVKELLETKHIRGTSENKRSTPAGSIDFESFIDFPTFLMHVLKLCALNNGIESLPLTETDDKRLLTFFEKNWEPIFGFSLSENPTEEMRRISRVSVMVFIQTLVIARHLHDGWVLKRSIDKKDWKLRHLENGKDEQGNDKLTNSFGKLHDSILMLQACLRVTYTSSLSMPWVTELLHLLWQHHNTPNDHGEEVLALLEGLASREIRQILEKFSDRDQDQDQDRDLDLGTGTPHILFNFLDYLLWRDGLVNPKNNNDREHRKFQFAYWNSVEHWYPQHPTPPDQEDWPNSSLSVDTFGNLFLLNSSDNSALSNLLPAEKLKRLQAKSENGLMLSLKAVDMMRATEKVGKSYKSWQDACKALAAEHIKRLKEAVKAVE